MRDEDLGDLNFRRLIEFRLEKDIARFRRQLNDF